MHIAHSQNTPWTPTPELRGGTIRFKHLLEGEEGSPGNFSLVIADTDISFKSPRHRHNFEQIRLSLEGPTNIGPRQNIAQGDLVYFPEGTYYGPQDQSLTGHSSLAMVVQFGGASGNGYMSAGQLREGHRKLGELGRFEDGIFKREAPGVDGRANQDAYEAIWERQNGRSLEYPKPRVAQPIHFHAGNIDWRPVADQPGASWKALGRFTERAIGIDCLRIEAGARHAFAPQAQPRILFIECGAGTFESGEAWERHSAVYLAAHEAPAMRASETTQAVVLALPRF